MLSLNKLEVVTYGLLEQTEATGQEQDCSSYPISSLYS